MSALLSKVKLHQIVAIVFSASLFMSVGKAWSQKKIHFALADGVKPISEWPYRMLTQSNDSIGVGVMRFYIHGIQCKSRGREVWNSSTTHYLFDCDSALTLDIPFGAHPLSEIDEISFMIGVDSTLQTVGAQSGSLDPIHGMYWTWQSGYIHWKLETVVGVDSSVRALTWHVGGYRAPFNTLRVCRFTGLPNSNNYYFTLDIHRLISEANADVPASIMSPSVHAIKLADIFQSCFQWQR